MGAIKDLARLGKNVSRTDSSDIPGIVIFAAIFGGIILFLIILNEVLKYLENKKRK